MKKKVLKIFLAIIAIILILISIVVIGGYIYINSKLNKINYEYIDKEELSINDYLYKELVETVEIESDKKAMSEEDFNKIKTFVIYGSDSRSLTDSYEDGRSDCIIIFSVDPTKKKITMISIPRDTYVQIPGYEKTKINHAFMYGKEPLSIKTINENFGLNISEYVTVNWEAVRAIVDEVGGIDITISKEERDYINKYIDFKASHTRGDNTKLKQYGNVHLNGTQALTHCGNRYVGNDFTRTERQRTVITALLNKVSKKSPSEINKIIDMFLPYVKTNLDINECKSYLYDVLWKDKDSYLSNISSKQIPSTSEAQGQMINRVYFFVPNSYDVCKKSFIKYLYEE